MNVVVLRGVLSSAPVARELRSGDVVVNYEVTTPPARDGVGADSVPVAWFSPPAGAGAAAMEPGTEVVVVGRVKRRYFRAGGGGTQSRTEVVADKVLPARRAKAAERAVLDALAEAEEAFVAPAA